MQQTGYHRTYQLHMLLGDHFAGEKRMYVHSTPEGKGDLKQQKCSSASSKHEALLGRFHLLEDSVRPNRQGGTHDGRETRFRQHFRRVLHNTAVAVGLLRLYGGVHRNGNSSNQDREGSD